MSLKKSLLGLVAGAALMVLAFQPQAAKANIFDWSISSGTTITGSGQFTTTGAGPTFTVSGVSGSITDTDISASAFTLGGMSLYAGADNLLYFPAATTPNNTSPGFVDFGGISFNTNVAGESFNLGGNAQTGPFQYVLNDSLRNPNGYPGQLGSAPIDMSVTAAVPEPSTWAMMLLGFAFVGFAGYRKSKSTTPFRLV